ncbi:MAG: hypothetical protein DME24_16270 [Verrucomicrobia bacterium]|nr:MAG: hypothetical protein DME24_16270 [Verrucomicrobiota bacterium]
MENRDKCGFVRSRLPWLMTAAALVVYLLTLNRWVSLSSLSLVFTIASKDFTPPVSAPLHFLLTFPVRWLPVGWQPVALNAFAAACASLTLGLLARSVALLPHDRTREQRQRERNEFALLSIPSAWAPPLFAVIACGLQLTFWEHATAATGEMLDLLLFAYVIRCLLEYRIFQRESWLTRSALVYGIAATNNYAMLGFFPAYLVALIWIKGSDFFEFRFVTRMFGCGTAGLTLYLLLPLLNALNDPSGFTFEQVLRMLKWEIWNGQIKALLGFPRYLAFIAGLTSLLPLLLIGIRWPSTFGETSPAGAVITTLLFRVVHAVLLVAGVWVAFDAPFGPRMLVDKVLQQMDEPFAGVSFLSFYYLGAVCLGYFVGYFLLIFRQETAKTWQRISAGTRLLNRAVTVAIWIAVIGLPVGLWSRNASVVRASDGSLLHEFARLMTRALPVSRAIALSDDPLILSLAAKELQKSGTEGDPILADTRLLPYAVYQESLHKRFPQRWPALPAPEAPVAAVDPLYLMYEVSGLAHSNVVYYLHPSFGYYFETLYLQPHGLVYHLAPYATNQITPPALADATVQENRKFWSDAGPALDRLAILISKGINDARMVGRWYSRALDWWGVESQKLGHLDDAAQAFALALKLNPGNVAVELNSSFNQVLRTKVSKPAETIKSLEEKFGRYRTWNALLAVNGPIDEPDICFRLGQTLASQSLFRQAASQFTRVLQLEPDNLDARLWLANVFLAGQIPDKALEVINEIRSRAASRPLTSTNQVELTHLEAMAQLSKGETNTAEALLLKARQQYPQNETLLSALAQFYVQTQRPTNALAAIEEQLKLRPNDAAALLDKAYLCMKLEAYPQAKAAIAAVLKKEPDNARALLDQSAICIQTKAYQEAIDPINKLLKLQPANQAALMNRAIAYLQSGQLDAARNDYEAIQKALPTAHAVYYGLGEIAFQRKDVPSAIKHYEAYLKYAPPDTKEAKQIAERLKQLKMPTGR